MRMRSSSRICHLHLQRPETSSIPTPIVTDIVARISPEEAGSNGPASCLHSKLSPTRLVGRLNQRKKPSPSCASITFRVIYQTHERHTHSRSFALGNSFAPFAPSRSGCRERDSKVFLSAIFWLEITSCDTTVRWVRKHHERRLFVKPHRGGPHHGILTFHRPRCGSGRAKEHAR